MKNLKSTYSLLVVCFIILSYSRIAGQTRFEGQISWANDEKQELTNFEGSVHNVDEILKKYCFSEVVPANSVAVKVISATYTYEKVSSKEAQILKKSNELGSDPIVQTFVGTKNGIGQGSVCFTPYILRNGEVLRVMTYTIEVEPQLMNNRLSRKAVSASSSVLASDGWFKVSVQKTGLFKITPSYLSSNGISKSTVSINDIRVVGNGTGMLSGENADARQDDLLDVPVKVYDNNNDGLFNGNDYALFYAKGPHEWEANMNSGVFTHQTNIYRDLNFYFISVENGSGAVIQVMPEVTSFATVQSSSYDEFDFRESETYNLVGTGRQWYGDMFDGVEFNKAYGFSFPSMDLTQDMRIRVRAIARASSSNTSMVTRVNGAQAMGFSFPAAQTGENYPYATTMDEETNLTFSGNPAGFNLQLYYNNSLNPSGVAWLDFVEIQCRSNLNFRGGALMFRDVNVVGTGSVAEFSLSNATSAVTVWKVTDHNDVKEMVVNLNAQTLTFKDNADQLEEYVAFAGNDFSEPTFVGAIAAQDLHGMTPPEMIIVAHPKFLSAAQRLADFHTNNDDIETKVVTVNEVYNEFSSGGQDITAIRDFARHLYKKAQAGGLSFKYMLLFGDASYDYKDRTANNSNYVPIWESESSLNLKGSYITDDYYGFLDDNEGGNGNITSLSGDVLDIGIGRIPCETEGQASAAVDKIINYTNGANRFGNWRSKILMMADDLDDEDNWEWRFVTSSEEFQQIVNDEDNAFNVSKVYSDAYKQVSTTGGESYPEAHDEMFRRVQQGCLVTNYIGHGGEIGLSSEKLLGLQDVNGWTNYDALSLFLTITCEFTRLDDPKRVSAGEQLALNPKGGAIGLLSTTRVVGADPAIDLNRSVFKTVFKRDNNQPKTLGEITMDSKNGLASSTTKLKFSLIGDPAVQLAIPYYNMAVTTVNGKSVNDPNQDTLKALSKVSVEGMVTDFSGQKFSGFDGVVSVSVYDKPTESKTLVNDGIGSPIPFELQNSLIYKGKVEVKDGDFDFEFIVPKDISFQYGHGKISLYADDGKVDAAGAYDTVLVGGFNQNPIEDDEGPLVQLYIGDESFVRGGVTDENPELYAVISDSSGINTVGNKIGHNLKAILDNDESKSFIVNEYYEADLNSYQSGTVRYPFYQVEEGSHTLSLEVFDVHNNFTIAETDFIVANSEELALKRVLNYPNPFTTHTDFQFEHNRADHPLEVQVQIFTVSGKLVKTINQLVVSQGNRVSNQVSWNGLDDYGDKIGKGVYVYRVKVKSQLDNSVADKYEKLVILR